MTTAAKTCFSCKKLKTLNDFYKHKQMSDGHLNKCKECTRADVRQHRRSDEFREKVLAYDRQRGNRQSNEYRQKLRLKDPEKSRARCRLARAVRAGKVIKPDRCQHCGGEQKLHGHHYDYSKPLSVLWLCPACHRQIHAFMDLVEQAEAKHREEDAA